MAHAPGQFPLIRRPEPVLPEQSQRDSNPCRHLERVAGIPLRAAQLGFRCIPMAECSACGFLHPKVGWRNVGRIQHRQ